MAVAQRRRKADPAHVVAVYDEEHRSRPYGALSRAGKRLGLSHTRVAQIVAQNRSQRVSFAAVTPTAMIVRPAAGWPDPYVTPRRLLETVQVQNLATSLGVVLEGEVEARRRLVIARRNANYSAAAMAACIALIWPVDWFSGNIPVILLLVLGECVFGLMTSSAGRVVRELRRV